MLWNPEPDNRRAVGHASIYRHHVRGRRTQHHAGGLWSWPVMFTILACSTCRCWRSPARAQIRATLQAPPSLAKRYGTFVISLQTRALNSGFVVLYKLPTISRRAHSTVPGTDRFNDSMSVSPPPRSFDHHAGGTFLGGILTTRWPGSCLVVFGALQIGQLSYVLIAKSASTAVDVPHGLSRAHHLLGTGAFQLLLLRMTMKQFPPPSTRLFSSLFALRAFSPVRLPASWWMPSAGGFFLFTIAIGIPA